jgi:hypothetical protein
MSAAKPPLSADEVVRILRLLAPVIADRAVVLVGGQAVAFWARFLGIDLAGDGHGNREPGLHYLAL